MWFHGRTINGLHMRPCPFPVSVAAAPSLAVGGSSSRPADWQGKCFSAVESEKARERNWGDGTASKVQGNY
jgi:hypothetical protein